MPRRRMLGGGPEARVASYRAAQRAAGPPSPGSVEGMQLALFPACPGTVIVHVDLTVECSVPGCRVSPSSRGAWLAKHADIRSCSDLREACPQCTVGTDHR